MHLIGPLQHIRSGSIFLVQVCLGAAGENEQVGIVAGGVALDFLKPGNDGSRGMEGGCVFCISAQLAGKIAGRFGIVDQVIGVVGILRDPNGLLPEVFSQFPLAQLIVGITLPVIAFSLGKLSGLSQAVGQGVEPVVVPGRGSRVDHIHGFGAGAFTRHSLAAGEGQRRECEHRCQGQQVDSVVYHIRQSMSLIICTSLCGNGMVMPFSFSIL